MPHVIIDREDAATYTDFPTATLGDLNAEENMLDVTTIQKYVAKLIEKLPTEK